MEDQQKLQILDIASICVCWFTMWSGFFFLTPRPPEQKDALMFLTMLIFLTNVVHMLILVGSMCIEMCKEKKESPLIQSIRKRTSTMVPNVVTNMRQRAAERRTKHRLSFDFANPTLGVVAPSAGSVQMVNIRRAGNNEEEEASDVAAVDIAAEMADAEEEVVEGTAASSLFAGEVKTTERSEFGKKKRKKKREKGDTNRPERLPGSVAASPPASAASGTVNSSKAFVDAAVTRRERLASIHARKKKSMQQHNNKNPMKNKHAL
jgi:hypothetical protein